MAGPQTCQQRSTQKTKTNMNVVEVASSLCGTRPRHPLRSVQSTKNKSRYRHCELGTPAVTSPRRRETRHRPPKGKGGDPTNHDEGLGEGRGSVHSEVQVQADLWLARKMSDPKPQSCPRIPAADLQRVCMIGVGRNGTTVWHAKYVGPATCGLERSGDVGKLESFQTHSPPPSPQ